MKYYQNYNVHEAAVHRINYLFDEFPNVCVTSSGGKDSTVILNLTLKIAEERGRLPLKVVFIDQEAEWQSTIDYMKDIMYDKRVDPFWLQAPMKLTNSTSHDEEFLHCWEVGGKWIRDKEPIAITENTFGTDRFHKLFDKIIGSLFPDEKACFIGGVRNEESPTRTAALTSNATYKHITYGKKVDVKKGHYTFYPIYDWTYVDVWKSICDNDWQYNRLYDYQYQWGRAPFHMRVSNVHHETATKDLMFMQEIEPETWNKIVERLPSVTAVKHLKLDSMRCPKEYPEAFESWAEYRDYLLEHLIVIEEHYDKLKKKFEQMDVLYKGINTNDHYKRQINSVLLSDHQMTKIGNWERRPATIAWREYTYKGVKPKLDLSWEYIKE